MITITSIKGETYLFDPETKRVFKDGQLIPDTKVEPVYSNSSPDPSNNLPRFSGLLFKESGMILSLSGKYNKIITDSNSIV